VTWGLYLLTDIKEKFKDKIKKYVIDADLLDLLDVVREIEDRPRDDSRAEISTMCALLALLIQEMRKK